MVANIVQETNALGYYIKAYTEPPTIVEMEADLMANGWRRGMLLADRRYGYVLLGLRYGGDGRGADLQLHIRPLDWLPADHPASPYRQTSIFTVRKHRKVAEQLEEDDVLVINDLNDDHLYIVSAVDLPPLGTEANDYRRTLLVKGGWFTRNLPHPLEMATS